MYVDVMTVGTFNTQTFLPGSCPFLLFHHDDFLLMARFNHVICKQKKKDVVVKHHMSLFIWGHQGSQDQGQGYKKVNNDVMWEVPDP